MFATIIIIAVILCLAGVFNLTNATLGVGLICFACFLGILARFWQAADTQDYIKQITEVKKGDK